MQPLVCPIVWDALKCFDQKIAEKVKACGCPLCGGILDWASFPRKPRGVSGLSDERRFSLCCRSCRKRVTPASHRFLWKKVYVLLVIALEPVKGLFGVNRRTVARWRKFWAAELSLTSTFIANRRHCLPVEFNFDITGVIATFADGVCLRALDMTRLLSPLGCALWLRFKNFRAEDAH